MNEGHFCKEIKDSLKSIYKEDCKVFKVHGGMYQTIGVGDLIGCVRGKYFEFEMKIIKTLPKWGESKVWGDQLFTANQIQSLKSTCASGGIGKGIIYLYPLKKALILNSTSIFLFAPIYFDQMMDSIGKGILFSIDRERGEIHWPDICKLF